MYYKEERIHPLEIPRPVPHDVTVSQLSETNTERTYGHSVKYLTENYPIPLQWGIARFDDASGAEGGISELSPIEQSQANINSDSSHTSVPALVKFRINKQDANSEHYGKFALYRVGGTSAVVKKVRDIYLTSQSDGSPLSVSITASSADPSITVTGRPTGAEWKVKWFGYGSSTSTHRKYHSGGIDRIDITNAGSGYNTVPTVTVASPGGSGKTATAKAIISGNTVTNIVITDKGNGYSTAPNVTFSGGGGSGAAGTAVIETESVQGESSF